MNDELRTLMDFLPLTSDQNATSLLLDYVENRLKKSGLQVERLNHLGVQSLYASTNGQKHSKVMLQAHIDVVPEGESFREENGRIYGRGCYDMLFGTVSFLKIIDTLKNPKDYDLSILLTGDEEIGGKNGVGAVLDDEGYSCDICLLPDAGEGLGTMSVAAKGVYSLSIKLNGTSHHGSRPWEGDGAGNKIVEFLTELSRKFDPTSRDNSTFVVSQLRAGNQALNQGPSEAFAGIDIRYKDLDDYERIHTEVEQLSKRFDVEVLRETFGRSFSLNVEAPIVKQFLDLYTECIGAPIKFIKAHGSSDARYFNDKNIPVIMFRPDGGNAHGDNEWLSVDSWKKFHDILERYVLDAAKVNI